ncbi:MAG TPA: hypothetical protein VFE47_01890 [Tepidisphaeraceae bacterium]|jgi:hypothetical protein|nr:hypothetical protein [Tepidisphaeraceae bacterium]
MKRFTKTIAIAIALVAAFILGRLTQYWKPAEKTTLRSLSPDNSVRIDLIEVGRWPDRDFDLRLENLKTGETQTIFKSPDEGMPVGSERILWSSDGKRLLLTGRHFVVREQTPIFKGASPYLMYDLPSGKIWCNATQQAAYPPFGLDDISSIKWENEK